MPPLLVRLKVSCLPLVKLMGDRGGGGRGGGGGALPPQGKFIVPIVLNPFSYRKL